MISRREFFGSVGALGLAYLTKKNAGVAATLDSIPQLSKKFDKDSIQEAQEINSTVDPEVLAYCNNVQNLMTKRLFLDSSLRRISIIHNLDRGNLARLPRKNRISHIAGHESGSTIFMITTGEEILIPTFELSQFIINPIDDIPPQKVDVIAKILAGIIIDNEDRILHNLQRKNCRDFHMFYREQPTVVSVPQPKHRYNIVGFEKIGVVGFQ